MKDQNYEAYQMYQRQLSEVKEQRYENLRKVRHLESLEDENQEITFKVNILLKEMNVSKDQGFLKHIYAVEDEFIECRSSIERQIEDREEELYQEKLKLKNLEENCEYNYRKRKFEIEDSK